MWFLIITLLWDVRASESWLLMLLQQLLPTELFHMVVLLNVRQTEGKVFTYSFILLLLPLHSTKSHISARGEAGGNRKWMLSAVVPTDTFVEEGIQVLLPGWLSFCSICSSSSHSQWASWSYFYQFAQLIIDFNVTVRWVPWLGCPLCPSWPSRGYRVAGGDWVWRLEGGRLV